MSEAKRLSHKKIVSSRGARVHALLVFSDTIAARFLLIMAIGALAVLYIVLVNSSSAANFKLTDLRKQSVALETDYQKAQLKQTALRSLDSTQEASKELNLVAAGKVQYAQTDTAVALAE